MYPDLDGDGQTAPGPSLLYHVCHQLWLTYKDSPVSLSHGPAGGGERGGGGRERGRGGWRRERGGRRWEGRRGRGGGGGKEGEGKEEVQEVGGREEGGGKEGGKEGGGKEGGEEVGGVKGDHTTLTIWTNWDTIIHSPIHRLLSSIHIDHIHIPTDYL